ncbi:MAG: hypothetical protein NVSMB56_09120 [Pyrinomonadaceae bacterium]
MEELIHLEQLSETEKLNLIFELKSELQKAQCQLHRLEELQNIFRLWVRIRQKLFPSNCSGVEIRGIDLVRIDSDIAGCVSTFLTRGRLDQSQKETLYYCNDCLDVVILELQGYEGWYYRQLKSLTSAIMEAGRDEY